MFENIDLEKKLNKENYKEMVSELEKKLGNLQRKTIELKIPIMIVVEGLGASGKGTIINNLLMPLDPRWVNVYTTNKLSQDQTMHPFLWPYWINTPAKGRITIFDKSWYRKIFMQKLNREKNKKQFCEMFDDIKSFEKQLIDDGFLIVKFFLHISKEEQKRRFKELEKAQSTSWRVNSEDWQQNQNYETYIQGIEETIQATNTNGSNWYLIEATDKKYAHIKVLEILIKSIEEKINEYENRNTEIKFEKELNEDNISSILNNVDLSKGISDEEYNKKIKEYQKTIRELEYKMCLKRIPVIILYEGWDASGKGGNIKRLTEKMDPRGYEVIPIAAPSEIEKAHHYLWRFWNRIPKDGHMAIFDRTWYGRVLVEKVEGLCTYQEWTRAYEEINNLERQLVNHGTVLLKFWLQIDSNEQLERFNSRQNDNSKNWKITDEDWRNREKWTKYEKAVDEMLLKTNTTYAPWTIVEGNCKKYARIKVLKEVINKISKVIDM